MIIAREGRNLRVIGALPFRARLFQMPGAKQWKDDQFLCEPSRANIEWLNAEFPAAEWRGADLDAVIEAGRHEMKATERAARDLSDFKFKTIPFNHQLTALAASLDETVFAYFMEMGTGKTKVLIDNVAHLFRTQKIFAVVLIAPNGVHRQFVNEQLKLHMPDDVEYETLIYQSGGKKAYRDQKAKFLRGAASVTRLKILAINVESLSVKSGKEFVEKFVENMFGKGINKPLLMAVDESTRIKNVGSIRSRNVYGLGRLAQYKRILSGAPVTRGVEDLYGQFKFLSDMVLGFKSFYTFRNRYCITEKRSQFHGADYHVVVGYQNIAELKLKMAPWSYRVKKEQCLDLPPKMYVTREVELSDQQRDLYNTLRRELMLELDGHTLTATMAAVKITKLQQILCGHIRFTDDGVLKILPDVPRFETKKALVEEAQGSVIVWARFTPDIDRLVSELQDFGVSRYDGKVDTAGRERSIANFKDGTNRVFVGQPASAGLGLNLVGPTTVIYFSNSFDAEHRWQSEDRNHRAGAEGLHITYYDLVVPGSIDSYILKVLKRKQDVASMTVDDMREMVREEL